LERSAEDYIGENWFRGQKNTGQEDRRILDQRTGEYGTGLNDIRRTEEYWTRGRRNIGSEIRRIPGLEDIRLLD
jgi:hypothetical protein